MWELDHKEGWVPKNWCFWTMVLEKTLESPLNFKEIKSVNPKGYQPWIFIGKTDAEAKAPIFWPPDETSQLIGKDPHARKDWRQKKRVTEYENRWMASLIQWTWTWMNFRRWWGAGRPDMLQSMELQRVGHDLATKQPPQVDFNNCSQPIDFQKNHLPSICLYLYLHLKF